MTKSSSKMKMMMKKMHEEKETNTMDAESPKEDMVKQEAKKRAKKGK